MKQNFIFAFALLATLLMVNAAPYQLDKRTIKFGKCPGEDGKLPLLDVTVSPDPLEKGKDFNVTVSGPLTVDIPENSMDWIRFFDKDYNPISFFNFYGDFCYDQRHDIKCPVKAGTKFSTVLTGVFAPDGDVAATAAHLRVLIQDTNPEPDVDIACTMSEKIVLV
ncbi:hypothetical protein C1645_820154 [Glomus cerebriforme]|uniref:Phosphatidylglycerol/phosphatidylinositol transfer protein n=1 Tax=Glomus cerebriforme TaxID=658196 RepID=A0A397T3F8_9GLOM|nr:hypothetical protein C1645_820154 [Glomus cerebriforme]